MTVYVLGINAFHADASACLLRDGELVAAAEEERFCRIKHWAGFPESAARYCLGEAGIGLRDVAHVAINQDTSANRWRKLAYVLAARPRVSLVTQRVRNRRSRASVAQQIEAAFGTAFHGRVHEVEHHLSHLASAHFASPFHEAVALSLDGFGDFSSAAWGPGTRGGVEVHGRVYFPHSLGIFYQAMTQFLGFPHFGDEYKVMGLAPYGEPRFLPAMRRVVALHHDGSYRLNLCYFRHHREVVSYGWAPDDAACGPLYAASVVDLLGPPRDAGEDLTQRHKDIACSAQAVYEEACFHLLRRLHASYGCDALVLAGGCAQNSVANGKIYRHTPFKKLYVQPAAGDAGGALGAALTAWSALNGRGRDNASPAAPPRSAMTHAYWGPAYSPSEIAKALERAAGALREANCVARHVEDEDDLCRATAAAIADGRVVGWFQGRMEWGPRALGNRSLLGDPRRADMKDILNHKIKRRESFRPFAPSILREAVGDWFEVDDDVPFMMQVYPIRADKRALVPAVTHVDGTGRLQTVTPDMNARYFRLIEAFRDITGVPMLLNTSFNENEPIVCTPAEALDCFLRTRMDILVLGNHVVERVESVKNS